MDGVIMFKYLRIFSALALITIVFWWGVMFPRFCTPCSDSEAGSGFAEETQIQQEYQIGLWVVDIWAQIRNFLGK